MDHHERQVAAQRAAIADYRGGLSLSKAAARHGLKKTTLHDRITGKHQLGFGRRGPKINLDKELEAAIVDWVLCCESKGFRVTGDELCDFIQECLVTTGTPNKFKNNRPSKKWVFCFSNRHKAKLAKRKAGGLSWSKAAVTEERVRKWFTELNDFVTNNGLQDVFSDPRRVINGNQTVIPLTPGKPGRGKGTVSKVLTEKKNESVTLLGVFTAAGDIVTPSLVFRGRRVTAEIARKAPPEWVLGCSENGLMTGRLFYNYVANGLVPWLQREEVPRPVMLFVDGHTRYMTFELSRLCETEQVILYALPPHTAHILQPADVSVFKPLKSVWRQVVGERQQVPETFNVPVTRADVGPLLKVALKRIGADTIRDGFHKCGLCPLDEDAPDYAKLRPSSGPSSEAPGEAVDTTSDDDTPLWNIGPSDVTDDSDVIGRPSQPQATPSTSRITVVRADDSPDSRDEVRGGDSGMFKDLHRAWCSIITAATSKQNRKKGELDPKAKRSPEIIVCKVDPELLEEKESSDAQDPDNSPVIEDVMALNPDMRDTDVKRLVDSIKQVDSENRRYEKSLSRFFEDYADESEGITLKINTLKREISAMETTFLQFFKHKDQRRALMGASNVKWAVPTLTVARNIIQKVGKTAYGRVLRMGFPLPSAEVVAATMERAAAENAQRGLVDVLENRATGLAESQNGTSGPGKGEPAAKKAKTASGAASTSSQSGGELGALQGITAKHLQDVLAGRGSLLDSQGRVIKVSLAEVPGAPLGAKTIVMETPDDAGEVRYVPAGTAEA